MFLKPSWYEHNSIYENAINDFLAGIVASLKTTQYNNVRRMMRKCFKSFLVMTPLFRNMRLMLVEMVQQNTSKFAILLEYKNLHVHSFFFISCYFIFFDNECRQNQGIHIQGKIKQHKIIIKLWLDSSTYQILLRSTSHSYQIFCIRFY